VDSSEPIGAVEESRLRLRLAKLEHYLREAEDCFQMGRYAAAGTALQSALSLAPDNPAAGSLTKRIESQLIALKSGNGHRGTPGSNGRGRANTVLLVDQDERVLIHLTETLKKYGLRTVSALDFHEAIQTVDSITPDLVISEVNFADGPAGYELFTRLRSMDLTRKIPFLFLATRMDREVLIAGKRLGVDDFLLKPVDGDVVAASVMNCLDRSRTRTSA